MNCANHADASAVAYCRTCGKALCANCTRPVRGVIYCEDCLGARRWKALRRERLDSFLARSPQQRRRGGFRHRRLPGKRQRAQPDSRWNSGRILSLRRRPGVHRPIRQGLAHLATLVCSSPGLTPATADIAKLGIICGFGIAFFYVYQIIDSVRSAKAIQMAQPMPDPFGLAATFGGGAKIEASKIPDGCDRAHLARRAVSAAYDGLGIRPRPLLAADFDRAGRLVVRSQLGPAGVWLFGLPMRALSHPADHGAGGAGYRRLLVPAGEPGCRALAAPGR